MFRTPRIQLLSCQILALRQSMRDIRTIRVLDRERSTSTFALPPPAPPSTLPPVDPQGASRRGATFQRLDSLAR